MRILEEDLIDISTREFKQLARTIEDDDGDVGRAEDAQLVGFLEEAVLALEKGDGTVAIVRDGCDRDLASAHADGWVVENGERGGRARRGW